MTDKNRSFGSTCLISWLQAAAVSHIPFLQTGGEWAFAFMSSEKFLINYSYYTSSQFLAKVGSSHVDNFHLA